MKFAFDVRRNRWNGCIALHRAAKRMAQRRRALRPQRFRRGAAARQVAAHFMMRASGDAAVACAAMTKWSSIPIGPRLLGVTDRPGLVTAEGDEPAAVSGAGERGVDDSAGGGERGG